MENTNRKHIDNAIQNFYKEFLETIGEDNSNISINDRMKHCCCDC